MTLIEEELQASQAAEPLLITDVERVEVESPATLPEGYAVDVTYTSPDDEAVNAQVHVPPGGVTEGERFTATAQYMDIPTDRWRDGLFSCFRFGCFHPVVLVGFFCFPVTLAQVMTRMDLTWIGDYRGSDRRVPSMTANGIRTRIFFSTFKCVMTIYIVYLVGLYIKGKLFQEMMLELPIPLFLPMSWWDFLFWVYCFVAVMKTRSYIRRKYSIPESECHGCEDCCCAFFCLPLTICQMARHTADYETYRAVPCNESGLPPSAPAIV